METLETNSLCVYTYLAKKKLILILYLIASKQIQSVKSNLLNFQHSAAFFISSLKVFSWTDNGLKLQK